MQGLPVRVGVVTSFQKHPLNVVSVHLNLWKAKRRGAEELWPQKKVIHPSIYGMDQLLGKSQNCIMIASMLRFWKYLQLFCSYNANIYFRKWGLPWSYLQPTTSINGSLLVSHRKMDRRWWRAQVLVRHARKEVCPYFGYSLWLNNLIYISAYIQVFMYIISITKDEIKSTNIVFRLYATSWGFQLNTHAI